MKTRKSEILLQVPCREFLQFVALKPRGSLPLSGSWKPRGSLPLSGSWTHAWEHCLHFLQRRKGPMLVRWNDWLHALIRSKLAQECINDKLTQCISLRENTQVLQAACKRMLKKFCQAETDEDEPVPAPAGPFGSHSKVEDWYDIVFAPVPTDQKGFAMLSLRKEQRKWIECNLLSHRREIELSEGDATVSEELAAHLFRPTSTIYGQGTDAALLSLQSLSATAPADNGQVVVCVAVAFRFNTLTGAPPFRVGKANSTNKDAANIKAWQQQAAGFDCVKYQQGSEEARTSATRRVYWTPGTVLPLHFLSMKLHVDCGICFEYCQRQQSVSCSKEHSVCQDCFTRVLEAAGAPNTLRRYLDERANVRCPADKCTEVFTLQQLANRLDKPQFEKLLNIQKVAHEQSVLPAALAAERKKMRAEFERIQAICDQDEREAARMRLDIIENVLVLKCPRCSAAFLDFSGCFALTCSRANCQAGFCAWCLQDCGNNNAHSHVASCPENKSARGRDVFGTQEAFDRHHEERRAREVRKRLAKASPAVTTYNISEKKKIISAMELMI
eukprot:g20579.t1